MRIEQVVFEGNDLTLAPFGINRKFLGSCPVGDMEVFVGHHGASTIIAAFADNVNFGDVKSIGIADDSADIEVVS